MASDKHDISAVRERLEQLVQSEGTETRFAESQRAQNKSFLAGMAFSGLIAGSILLTHYIDTQIQITSPQRAASTAGDTIAPASPGAAGMSGRVSAIPHGYTRITNTPMAMIARPEVVQSSGGLSATLTPPVSFTAPVKTESAPFVKVSGLSTARSVITGVVDPITNTASYYWTFALKNTSKSAHEAKMRISLPTGAVVSRATLWINGRPEEAAFNSTWSVQNAYDWIVERHRDPLVITQEADGNILLKASPVMPNKEMKIRIGMTIPMEMNQNGEAKMALPQVIDSNLDLECKQNIHVTSPTALSSSDPRISAVADKTGSLLRGNVESVDLKSLLIRAKHDQQLPNKFATRATHSNPAAFILAELQKDNQGQSKLVLTKSFEKPDDYAMINDDHAAFRLSYLWVKSEIERLVQMQDQTTAVDLATVYRVVSPVSGAVVLERQSDYDYNGLDRNMYKALSYHQKDAARAEVQDQFIRDNLSVSSQGVPGGAGGPSAGFAPPPQEGSAMLQAPTTSARRRAAHDSKDKGYANKEIGANDTIYGGTKGTIEVEKKTPWSAPQAVPQTKASPAPKAVAEPHAVPLTDMEVAPSSAMSHAPSSSMFSDASASCYSAETLSASDNMWYAMYKLAGPVFAWLQNVELINGGLALLAAEFALVGMTFAGGLVMLALAGMRARTSKSEAIMFAAGGLIWLAVGTAWPLVSQVFAVALAAAIVMRCGFSAMKAATQR